MTWTRSSSDYLALAEVLQIYQLAAPAVQSVGYGRDTSSQEISLDLLG